MRIRLDPDLETRLDRPCRQTDRNRSDVVGEALRRQCNLLRFERLRDAVLLFVEA
ncbi:MAG: ribbon-helix-helix protein, CopG family [Nitrospirae bacterium]|nr:MAG: ribbon-helix-helix protein, CopG family [Nitrospirota bacterium]